MFRFLSNKQAKSLSEQELIQRFQDSGDPGWLGQLYAPYIDLVYGLCLKYLKQEQDAEDAVMAIFEQLVKKLPDQEVRDFRPWLYVLAKNHCLMELRRNGRKVTQEKEAEFMYFQDLQHPKREALEKELQLQSMEDCMQKLPKNQQTCIQLFYLEQWTYKEIASKKEIPLGQVRSYIQNGRRNLRLCMEKKNQDPDQLPNPIKSSNVK